MEVQAAFGLEAGKAAALRIKSKGGPDRLREKHQAKVDELSWRNWAYHPTPQFKTINFLVLSFLYSPTLTSIHDHWKNHSLD